MNRAYAPTLSRVNADPAVADPFQWNYIDRRRYFRRNASPAYPRFLYRYTRLVGADATSVDRLRDVIVRGDLWLASPQDLNDPFDMAAQPIFVDTGKDMRAYLDGLLKRQMPEMGWKERQKNLQAKMTSPDQIRSELFEAFRLAVNNIGVCCFSSDPRNIQMWSHYGNQHEGLVLQFEPTQSTDAHAYPMRVDYSDEYPTIDWVRRTNEDIQAVMLRKHTGWAYEREWRLVWTGGARSYLPFNPSVLRAAILGCRFPSSALSALKDLLAERAARGRPPMRIYRAEMHHSAYRLRIVKGAM